MELPIYGLGRVGVAMPDIDITNDSPPTTHFTRRLNRKFYELTDHLGNVRAVLGDRKQTSTPGSGNYFGEIRSYQHVYPFGMPQPGRVWDSSLSYRYGFNGMETDPEVKRGAGKHYTTFFRQYDPRLGRWWSNDPVAQMGESPYAAMYNNPIGYSDPFGDCPGCRDPKDEEVGTERRVNGDLYRVDLDMDGQKIWTGVVVVEAKRVPITNPNLLPMVHEAYPYLKEWATEHNRPLNSLTREEVERARIQWEINKMNREYGGINPPNFDVHAISEPEISATEDKFWFRQIGTDLHNWIRRGGVGTRLVNFFIYEPISDISVLGTGRDWEGVEVSGTERAVQILLLPLSFVPGGSAGKKAAKEVTEEFIENVVEQGLKKEIKKDIRKAKVGTSNMLDKSSVKSNSKWPTMDATGKVHGDLPSIKDIHKYSREDLEILLSELKKSVQKRIEVTSKLGRDRGHGQRQGAEQDLIKSIEKYLKEGQ